MPTNPKYHKHGSTHFITTSVEEGLMFPPNPLIEFLLLTALIKAQTHHPGIDICHFIMNTTHVHMVIYVNNPDDVKGFMNRFKSESSNALNRLLGRNKRTIWCEGYDSPAILDEGAARNWIAYIYKNASKDGLVDSIDNYPGLSSWKHFLDERDTFEGYSVPRTAFKRLSSHSMKKGQYINLVRKMCKKNRQKMHFLIKPNKWMKSFSADERQAENNRKIIEDVRNFESELSISRQKNSKKVIGIKKLIETEIGAPYIPERKGRKTLCLTLNKELRKAYIVQVKAEFQKGREVLEQWKMGNKSVPYPLGLYPPPFPKIANLSCVLTGETVNAHW